MIRIVHKLSFKIECWLERIKIRWILFWDYFRYHYFKRFRRGWKDQYSFPPDREGYK